VTARSSAVELSKHDKKIVQKYLSLLDLVPGPISVWVTTDEGLLHFYTLIEDDRDTERTLYSAEVALMREIDPVWVDFDVYVHPETVHEFLFKDVPPLYQRR
jgi:hypothetical protein